MTAFDPMGRNCPKQDRHTKHVLVDCAEFTFDMSDKGRIEIKPLSFNQITSCPVTGSQSDNAPHQFKSAKKLQTGVGTALE
jgi:hypothetical protein